MVRIGINGLGVMGRYLLRAIEERIKAQELGREDIDVVAFNDLAPADQLAPLIAHDSIYLRFPGFVESKGKDIIIDGKTAAGFSESQPSKIPWGELGVDIVYESTGAFVKKPGIEGHLEAGAKKVVYSAPSDFADATIVMGVNDEAYNGERIVSNASCTTNCLAPLALALYKKFGEYYGLMTTIHAYTSDQKLQDAPHKDTERAYAAAMNLIPTSTGAAKAIGKVIPGLDGKLAGMAVRVPLAVGSIVDLVVILNEETTAEEVNLVLQTAGASYLRDVLQYREGPIVSSMVIGSPVPCVVDAKQTAVGGGSLVKVLAHYDNVAGYSHQAIRLIKMIGGE